MYGRLHRVVHIAGCTGNVSSRIGMPLEHQTRIFHPFAINAFRQTVFECVSTEIPPEIATAPQVLTIPVYDGLRPELAAYTTPPVIASVLFIFVASRVSESRSELDQVRLFERGDIIIPTQFEIESHSKIRRHLLREIHLVHVVPKNHVLPVQLRKA